MPYGDNRDGAVVLRIKRTLDGVEIDKIISDVETEKTLTAEHRRRADRRKAELAGKSFSADVLEPAMPRPSELRLRGSILCLPDGVLCSFHLDWNLYFHIAMMVNTLFNKVSRLFPERRHFLRVCQS
jgi:hypothetical protein